MAVTVVDPAAGVIQRGIASVGEALGQRLRERGNNAARIINDPVRRNSIAEAYRAALQVGPEEAQTLLDSLRVPDDFGETLLSFVATPDELGRVAERQTGAPSIAVEADVARNIRTATEDVAAVSSGVIDVRNTLELAQSNLSIDNIEALRDLGVVDVAAVAEVTRLRAQTEVDEAALETELARRVAEGEAAAADVQRLTAEQTILQDVIPAQATAARIAAQVQAETGQALLNGGSIAISADNNVRQAILDRRSLSAQEFLGIPEARANAEFQVLTQQALDAEYAAGLVRQRIIEGVPELTISREVLELNARIGEIEDSIEFANAAGEYLDSLDQTTVEGKRLFDEFILGMENPSFLAHIGIHEQLESRDALSRATVSASNSAERFSNTLTMLDEISDAVATLAAAETDEIPAAVQKLNNLRHLASQMMVTGRLEPIDLIGADMHGKRFEYFYEDVDSDAVHFAIGVAGEGLLEGETPEQVLEAIHEPAEELGGRSLYDSLSQRDQRMFDEKFPLLVEDAAAAREIIDERVRTGLASIPSERGQRAQQRSAANREVMLARARETLEDRNAPRLLRNAIDAGDRREIGIMQRRIAQAQALIEQGPLFERQMILPGTSPQDLLELIQETFPEVGNLPR